MAMYIVLLIIVIVPLAFWIDYLERRKCCEPTVQPRALSDQEILNSKCHAYLKGDHW